MERPLHRRRSKDEHYDFGWGPRASQLASPSTSASPARHDERERRRRRRRNSGDRERDSSGRREGRAKGGGGGGGGGGRVLPTDYRGALSRFSPPVPHALLKKIGTKDVQGLGKVRVVLRVSPSVKMSDGESEVITLDKRRRQVTLVDPQARQAQESRVGVAAPKMFAFDQVYTQEDPQSEVVSGAVVDVLHAVLAGNDGCVLCFGGALLGKTYTMLGSHTGPGELGVVPSAVAWLYRAIVEQKAKSGARFSVRVSAVAVDAAGAMLTDLLADYAQEGEASPSALLRDTTGGYLSSVAELRAPSPETAAHYLDVAIAARSSHARLQGQSMQQAPPPPGSATLLYTLHIYQYAVDKSGKGGVVGGRSRLHMIDMGDLSGSSGGMSLSALTSVLLAIFNGQRYLPNRENKLTMLLREVLGSVTCHAAMVVHISPSPRHAQHTLATLQLASRVHRMRRKKLKGLGGSSSGGSSEGSHSRSSGGDTSAGSSSLDFSSSEQSCDTVIYIGGSGPGDTTDNEHPPVFMSHHTNQQMWPITRLRSMEHLRPHSASPTPAHTRRAASASPTPTSRSVPNGRSQLKPKPPPRTVSNVSNSGSAGKASPGAGFIRHQPGVSHVVYNSSSGQQPLLSSFKPQVTLGPLVPGDLRHFNYKAYEEPNNMVPIFQRSHLPIPTQHLQNQKQLEQQQQHQQQKQQQQQHQKVQQQLQQQQQYQHHQKLQQQQLQHVPQQQPQNMQQHIQNQQVQQQLQQYQQHAQKQVQNQQQPQQQQQQQQSLQQQQQQGSLNVKGASDAVVSDEQWIDGPRMHKSRVTAAQKIKTNKSETWVDGPQVMPIGYGFMDDHKKTMIERWVAVQTAQVVQQLEQQQTVPAQMPAQTSITQQQFTHLTQFRTCEESTLDSDQDTLSEDPPSGPGRPAGLDAALPPQPNLIEELERKNLIPAENPEEVEKPAPTPNESEGPLKETNLDEKSTEPHCSPDEASGVDEPSIDDICSQCEALAEECEELSSLLSCEEEECKRQAHLGLATVLEEPELEAAIIAEDQVNEQEEDETGHEADEEASTTPRRGWVRRSLASSGTHHSTELIEVQVPDHPVVTVDCCIQVCEEDILRALADTPCQSEVMSVETSDDHPLRVLSEENLTCASTFTDSYSQKGETGDEDDSDDDDSRPFSLFEVTNYGRVCQDLSLALQSDVANRNLHELAKIHDLYRTLARQSPRVHTGGPRLQAATLAEILANSHDSLLENQKPPLEDDSICSEPVQADEKLCRHCNKKRLRHGDSILRLESALRSKSQWLSRPLEILEDSASDKCIGTDDLEFPEDHCTCDVQSDLVPYIPSMFFNFSSVHNPDVASDPSLTHQASEARLHLKDAPLADSTEKLADRVPINGVSLPEFIEDVEANVVLCNPVQYDYSKDEDVMDMNDERTVTGKSDNESDCVSNISEDSEYMMQTSKLSKFLCVGVGRSKSKTPYKVAKQNNNKLVENKKNMAKLKESKVKIPAKSRENSKSPDRNSKNLIKSPSRVVSQSAAKQSVSRRGDTTSVRPRWGKSARVGAAKPPSVNARGNYRYTCTLMYPPDAPTPTEGYDSGHDSGAATQGSATPLENNEAWRTAQNLQPHQHHQHHHPAANSGSLGTNPSLGESSGYESIPRDSECSSFSSSQDSEMDDEQRRDAQAHSQAFLHPLTQPKPQVLGASSKVQVEEWSEEDVKRYEGRPCAAEVPHLRASRHQILSLKSAQRSLKADLAQAKENLNVPADSWSYERKSNYT